MEQVRARAAGRRLDAVVARVVVVAKVDGVGTILAVQ